MRDGPVSTRTQFGSIMAAYLIFAAVFGFAYRYALNPDGLSLLRLAGYIADGNFQWSVTKAWSPLITWLIAPFLYPGLDGQAAARTAIALCGAGMVVSCWYLASRFDLSPRSRFIAVMIAALLISFWTVQFIAADVLLAALIIWYLYLTMDPDILISKKKAFFCGIAGGIAYLAHHYAMPFFLVHFPLLLFVREYLERDKGERSLKRAAAVCGAGIAGFMIIASVWVGAVSVKYGNLTLSSKGPIARASIGPEHRGHPFFSGGLYKPRDPYAIHVFEDPSEVRFHTWSPFESREYFVYQLRLIADNINFVLNHLVKMSPYFTYAFMIGVLALVPVALVLNKMNEKKKLLYAWFVVTFCVYCSGFVLITARSPRRFYTVMILVLFLAFHFLDELMSALRDNLDEKRRKFITVYLLIIFISAFALKPGVQLAKSVRSAVAVEQVNPYKEIAGEISGIGFPEPYAVIRSAQKPHTDLYIAYYLEKQFLGRPASGDIDGITRELIEAGAKSLLVFDNPETVAGLKRDARYAHLASKKLKKDSRYSHAVNIEQDNISDWDEEVNIFVLE